MPKLPRNKLTYRHDKINERYDADDCLFATHGLEKEEVHTFMDGDLDILMRMFTALFSSLMNKNLDVAYHVLTACMSLMATAMGLDIGDVSAEEEPEAETTVEVDLAALNEVAL
jgi:hypothetical protein